MRNTYKRMMDELYTRTTGRFIEGQTELDLLSDDAIVKIFRARARKALRDHNYPTLSSEDEKMIRDYYRGVPRFSLLYHRVYAGRVGRVVPEYMPEDLYYGYIEPYYIDREAARYIDNKALYYHYFPRDCMPELIVSRVGRLWFGADGSPIRPSEVMRILTETPGELVLKIAENSEEGAGVYFLPEDRRVGIFKKYMREIQGDVVVQRAVVQHPEYAALHPESVNTIRVFSMLTMDGVKILISGLKIGANGVRKDNLNSGGVMVGIRKNYVTGDTGVIQSGDTVIEHPTLHYPLGGHPLPGVGEAYALVKRLHPILGRFRIASWDIAIDTDAKPVLIETNVSLGGIANIQVCSGPLFGADTRAVCEEVFGL